MPKKMSRKELKKKRALLKKMLHEAIQDAQWAYVQEDPQQYWFCHKRAQSLNDQLIRLERQKGILRWVKAVKRKKTDLLPGTLSA